MTPARDPVSDAAPVLVTRPLDDARRWVRQLRQQGLQAEALPLIAIEPLRSPAELDSLWQGLDAFDALMFVSSNAVVHFWGDRPRSWPAQLRGLAPGPGTARALVQQGVPAALVDTPPEDAAQFDSEALWQVVGHRSWQGRRVLIVRGQADSAAASPGRDWLAGWLLAAGAEVELVPVYRRAAPRFDDAQLGRIRAAQSDGSLWLFSSSEALRHLPAGLCWEGARALATHGRIAQSLREAGFGWVGETRPTLADVVGSIKSLNP